MNKDISTINKQLKEYTFIDLFAGIGGTRIGFEKNGYRCVFSSEFDTNACRTYEANFGEIPFGDITKISSDEIPDFDILLGGFPCQAFSMAGQRGGFNDIRGTMFFEIARILKEKSPKAFLLENVKGLLSHDKSKTFNIIIETLKKDLGYKIFYKILNSKDFGLAQNRERIYIVGFKNDVKFVFPKSNNRKKYLKDILEKNEVSSKYYLSDTYINTLKKHKKRHAEKGNGFGYEILSVDGIANTLMVGGMGRERNLIYDNKLTDFTPKTNIKGKINSEFIRCLTPREWARLQGFDDSFKIPVSDTQAYKQFGNTVSIPVVSAIAKQILKALNNDQ